MMPRTEVTYGQLDNVLRGLGFSRQTLHRNGKGVRYEHPETHAIVLLPSFRDKDRVYLHHLDAVRVTLDNFGIADPTLFEARLQKAG